MHHRRPSLALALALLIALAVFPLAPGRARAGTDYVAACNTNLRSVPSLTAPTLEVIAAGVTVTTEGITTGDSWTASCPGSVSGNTWYQISAVNGVSTLMRYGTPLVYAATGLFQLPGLLPPPPPPSVYTEGIDVSKYQGSVDWPSVALAGKRFAIMRATLGTTYVDPAYATNHDAAKAAGIQVGAYHFATPAATAGDAVLEADWFVQNAGLQAGDLVPALDIEQNGGLSVANLQAWVGAWLGEVYARLGVRPMIYTSPNFWKNSLGSTTMFADQGYAVLWVAHWFVTTPTVPAANWGGHGWAFWQYDDCGSVPGIAGCVDLDRYNGTDLSPVAFGYAAPPPVPSNPSPVLGTVAPPTITTSTAPQTITLGGSGFVPGISTAYWNGQPLPTTYVSSTSLTAVVPPTLSAGTTMVTVTNAPPGGGSTAPLPLTVTIPSAQVTLGTSASVTTWGGSVTLSVSLAGAAGASGANRAVTLQRMGANETEWHDVTTLTTDAAGVATFAYRPPVNAGFQAIFAGAPDLGPGTSQPVRVVVRQLMLLRPTNAGATRSLPVGAKVTFTGTVRPVGTGAAPTVTFRFRRLVNGRWTTVASRTTPTDANGRATWTWIFSARGRWYVRAIANPTTMNANSVWSPIERYSIY